MSLSIAQSCQAAGRILYGLYAWVAFVIILLLAILAAVFLPGLALRRRAVRAVSRLFFRLVAIPISINGLDELPDGHCVVVANHASYIDGVILQAVLPPRFSFVIKGEVRKISIVHFFLRRIDAKFVERNAAAGSARDARTLVRAATAGESLAFFAEGTFIAQPGLGRFRPGAFRAAIKGELPVVPISIRGSRAILRAKTLMPRRGSLQIDILPKLETANGSNDDGSVLAELARQSILTVLDEPDLLLADS